MEKAIPRAEYPRPDFMRESWMCLNGEWDFRFDHENRFGDPAEVEKAGYGEKITVPFCPESAASGIGRWEDCQAFWYKRTVSLSEDMLRGSVLLKFGAVDHEAHVWVNGLYIGMHTGGNTSFSFNVAHAARAGENTVVVRALDDTRNDKPRGKQSWTGEKFGCWYTPTSGIWQPVWMEFTGKAHVTQVKLTPDVDSLSAGCEVYASTNRPCTVTAKATMERDGKTVCLGTVSAPLENGYRKLTFSFEDDGIRMYEDLLWSPSSPRLIDVEVTLSQGDAPCDRVQTYFGMRKISVQGDVILLNNDPLYQRLILDQGYWPDSLLTPPSDEAIVKDIELTKAMGFNGARKHQKVEDPRYYYWADKLGLLVWGELPSAYGYNSRAVVASQRELGEFILRDYNHPCIITWVTINESWGVQRILNDKQQQNHVRALCYFAKSLDGTRLVSENDGWEQTDAGDICALHDYALFPHNTGKYDDMDRFLDRNVPARMIYAEGHRYTGKPVIMTEYGGVAFVDSSGDDWGYFGKVKDEKEFLDRVGPVTSLFLENGRFAGFCYTQLTDVMQEVNGLLDPNRVPKIPVEKLKAVFGKERYWG